MKTSTYGLLAFQIALAAAIISQGGCAGRPESALSFYDTCSDKAGSFSEMAACGKANRQAYCQDGGRRSVCSADGNALVSYADALAKAVANHEMSEAQAQMKWVEFRNAQVNAERQRQATLASGGPSTCTTVGNVTNCY
jgi:hypothetical protein